MVEMALFVPDGLPLQHGDARFKYVRAGLGG